MLLWVNCGAVDWMEVGFDCGVGGGGAIFVRGEGFCKGLVKLGKSLGDYF